MAMMNSWTSSSSSSTSSAGSGPAWDWSSLFGREEESKLLASLVETPQRQQQETKQREKDQSSDAGTSCSDPHGKSSSLHPGATVLVHGAAGSGKSSLIETYPWEEQHGWWLVSGKFESNQDIPQPFSGLIEALNELVNLWLLRNDSAAVCQLSGFRSLLDEDVEFLRHVLPKAYRAVKARANSCRAAAAASAQLQSFGNTGSSGKLTAVSEQNSIPHESADQESRHRHRSPSFTMKQDLSTVDCLNASFVRILTFLCQTHPVVLFLDDIQWADAASSKVLQVLATTGQVDNMLLILSYRDEEILPESRMQKTLQAIKLYAAKEGEEQKQVAPVEDELAFKRDEPIEDEQVSDKGMTDSPGAETEKVEPQVNQQEKPTQKRRIHDLPILDLTVDSVNALLSSLTRRPLDETLPLAQVVHRKTAGNAFFVTQFLQMLRQEDFLRYSFATDHWEWGNVDHLQSAAHVSDNVADIVATTLQHHLPESTRVALKVAACLGKVLPLHVLIHWFDSFDATGVSSACYQSLHQVRLQGLQSILDHAVTVGVLIRPKGQDAYMWAHDKLQAVAYSIIPVEHRPTMHLKLGRLLWNMSQEDYPEEEWMVFMAADQMNRYSTLLQQLPDKERKEGLSQHPEVLGAEVASLCLEASRLSLAKSALYPAYDMLQAGISHLNIPEKWNKHYDLCLNLYSTMAEMAVQLGKGQEAEQAVEEVETHARSLEDKFRVQLVHVKHITSGTERNYQLGLQTATDILKEYGVRMPNTLLPGMLALECTKLRRRLPGGKMEGLLAFPILTDTKTRNIIKLLTMHGFFGMVLQKKNSNHLMWYSSIRILSISADHKALSEEAAMAVVSLGMSHGKQGRIEEANEYGELARKILDRFPQTVGSIHASVTAALAFGIFSYTKPMNKCLDLWLEAHHIGLRTGNTEKAGGAILGYSYAYMSCGLPLGPLQSDLYQYEKEVVQFNLPGTVLANFKIFEQFILNLQKEHSPDPTMLNGEAMNQDDLLASFHGHAHKMTKRDVDSFRVVLALLYGKLDTAEKLILELEPFLDSDQFYVRGILRRSAMGLMALKISRTNNGKRKLRKIARKIVREFREDLKNGNANALPLLAMLNAEESPSKEGYENAIRSCARLGLISFEAYMCEQAGLYFLDPERKDDEWAEFYLAQAVALYADWGADGKVQQLRKQHARLLRSSLVRQRANTALKGRSRYSSSHTDLLMDFDWERLSTSTINTSISSVSASSRSGLSSSTMATVGISSLNHITSPSPSDKDKNDKLEEDDDKLTSSTDDVSEHSSGEFGMRSFMYVSAFS